MKHEWSKEELAASRRCRTALYDTVGEQLVVLELRLPSRAHPYYLVRIGDCQSFAVPRGELIAALAALAHVALAASIKADRENRSALLAALA